MISVIISKENLYDDMIEVREKNDINHLKNSFRIKNGEIIRAVDGEYEYICEVIEIEKKFIKLKIKERNVDSYSTQITVDVAMGILKNDKMDLTIQKLTEIGINKIIPLVTKRGVVKLTEKKDKWDLISKEALKQCQGVKFLEIDEIKSLKEINYGEYDLIIVPYECEERYMLKNILKELKVTPKKILYIIGPEGGFEKDEVEYIKENKGISVSLGKRILRAETASIVVGGILVNGF